jgi:hypothetical protein
MTWTMTQFAHMAADVAADLDNSNDVDKDVA